MTVETWGIIVGIILTVLLVVITASYPVIRLLLKAAAAIASIETTIVSINNRVTTIQRDMVNQRDTCKSCSLEVHGKLANHEGRIVVLEHKIE